jgi:hypothetical protein
MNDSARSKTPAVELKRPEASRAETEPLSGKEIMQAVLARPSQAGKRHEAESRTLPGVIIGTFCGLGDDGQALVTYEGVDPDSPLAALSTAQLTDFDSGRPVALAFIGGDPQRPTILGLIHQPETVQPPQAAAGTSSPELDVALDGERVTLSADKEIVLKCGKSSITLTKAGKIIIKGAYLSNTSTGVNRIKGGSVQIN